MTEQGVRTLTRDIRITILNTDDKSNNVKPCTHILILSSNVTKKHEILGYFH